MFDQTLADKFSELPLVRLAVVEMSRVVGFTIVTRESTASAAEPTFFGLSGARFAMFLHEMSLEGLGIFLDYSAFTASKPSCVLCRWCGESFGVGQEVEFARCRQLRGWQWRQSWTRWTIAVSDARTNAVLTFNNSPLRCEGSQRAGTVARLADRRLK